MNIYYFHMYCLYMVVRLSFCVNLLSHCSHEYLFFPHLLSLYGSKVILLLLVKYSCPPTSLTTPSQIFLSPTLLTKLTSQNIQNEVLLWFMWLCSIIQIKPEVTYDILTYNIISLLFKQGSYKQYWYQLGSS